MHKNAKIAKNILGKTPYYMNDTVNSFAPQITKKSVEQVHKGLYLTKM